MRTIATAGHVDHGKSALVLALTGTDPDRFAEEKERGLTIDLGFAFTTMPSGAEVGFVDVPGHVRFIKNMLAGVGGVDLALLVVAATEGLMPQSEEHLQILELLDVRHGMVAVTKADLVDDDALELVCLEVEERVSASSLAGATVVACDSRTGRGIDDVRAALDAIVTAAPEARDVGRPRLWVDRAFAATGAGTVVTGTLTGGPITVGDALIAGMHPVRVRGIQTAGRQLERASPGTRVALNLAGVEHHAVVRGDAVVRPGEWGVTAVVDVGVLPTIGPANESTKRAATGALPERSGRLQAYVGSGEHGVSVRTLDDDGRFARLRLDAPLPLAPGDRLVLRDPGSRQIVAGAEVLDARPSGRARDAAAHLERPLGERLLARERWLALDDLPSMSGLSLDDATALAERLVRDGTAARADQWIVDTNELERVRTTAVERALAHHAEHPHDPGLDVTVLARSLGVAPEQLHSALEGAPDVRLARGVVRHASHSGDALTSPDARRVVAAFDASPFSPPSPDELGDAALVRALVRAGALVDVEGTVFAASALERARELVVDALRERGTVTIADVRDLLGSTRKFVVPIVGWLDRQGVTRRRGDDRIAGPASGIAAP